MPFDYDDLNNYPEFDIEQDNYCFYCPYCYRQMPPMDFYRPQPMNNPKGGPPGPPPKITPSKGTSPSVKAVSPGSIKPCVFRYVYIWLDNGSSFWAWLNRVDMRTASGYRWNGRRWAYFGIDLRRIESFECY